MKKEVGTGILVLTLIILISLLVIVFVNPKILGFVGIDKNDELDPFALEESIALPLEDQNDLTQDQEIVGEDAENSNPTQNMNFTLVDEIENVEEFTGTLSLRDITYTKIQSDKVEITSMDIIFRNPFDEMSLEILVYIYDQNDSEDKKGLVREQIWFSSVDKNEVVSTTSELSATYLGDLSGNKEVRISLIGYNGGNSINIASDRQTILFS
jgi:hypothetical protein